MSAAPPLGWIGILRLGLVQTALGGVVVLTTSTLNRVMAVELALPAMLPGALVALHYAVQVLRPRFGHGSDAGRRRTPWIVGGMAVLAMGGAGATLATVLMAKAPGLGILLAVLAFLAIGAGVGAAGTSLLALLATRVAPARRAAAGATVWLMMIAGFAVTASVMGALLEPFSLARLLAVGCGASAIAFLLATLAVAGIEGPAGPAPGRDARTPDTPPTRFRAALAAAWAEPRARRFTGFVFVSMLAYSAQDLILEPFAGHAFGYTAGASTALAGQQHGGVFLGMVLVGVAQSGFGIGTLRAWTIGGCLASATALAVVGAIGIAGLGAALAPAVVLLGLANGAFAVAAISSMMGLAGAAGPGHEGTRMGLWGAAQAIAFGLGGFGGAAAADLTRLLVADPGAAYGLVFAAAGAVFLLAAHLAARVETPARPAPSPQPVLAGE